MKPEHAQLEATNLARGKVSDGDNLSALLRLPERVRKPRQSGLTCGIDPGMATQTFCDIVASHADLIDLVKFGWGTGLVTRDISTKVKALRSAGILYCFGGTLFEKALAQGQFDAYLTFCHACECPAIEVSDGTIEIGRDDRSRIIRHLKSQGLRVLAEVGHKDYGRSAALSAAQWIDAIGCDFEAGADYVILESRESGKIGICKVDGTLRLELIQQILASGLPIQRLIFEAPEKIVQEQLIKRIGPNVNLGNIALENVVGVETLRLGLRFDTFMHFEDLHHAE